MNQTFIEFLLQETAAEDLQRAQQQLAVVQQRQTQLNRPLEQQISRLRTLIVSLQKRAGAEQNAANTQGQQQGQQPQVSPQQSGVTTPGSSGQSTPGVG